MKVNLTDVYGQTITISNVVAVFSSNTEDDILCVKVSGEPKALRYNLNTLNYWECIICLQE